MQLSIFAITIPPRTLEICTKNLPPPWGFASKLLPRGQGFAGAAPGGRGFFGAAPGERAFVYKRCLPYLEFSI